MAEAMCREVVISVCLFGRGAEPFRVLDTAVQGDGFMHHTVAQSNY